MTCPSLFEPIFPQCHQAIISRLGSTTESSQSVTTALETMGKQKCPSLPFFSLWRSLSSLSHSRFPLSLTLPSLALSLNTNSKVSHYEHLILPSSKSLNFSPLLTQTESSSITFCTTSLVKPLAIVQSDMLHSCVTLVRSKS